MAVPDFFIIFYLQMSFAPRSLHNLNENMEFDGIQHGHLETLQESLALKIREERLCIKLKL